MSRARGRLVGWEKIITSWRNTLLCSTAETRKAVSGEKGPGELELQAQRKQPQTQSEWVRKTLGQLWDYSLDDICRHKIHLVVWWFSC